MSVLGRIARGIGGKGWFLRIIPIIVPFDRAIGRATRGRISAMNIPELPTFLITTTGRRTGLPRTQPLLFAHDGDSFVVAGSNFGKPDHPAWSGNLLANPDAQVMLHGEVIAVRAHFAEGAERERLMAVLTAVWPHYPTYAKRSGRHLRVFRLDRR
jgi:deazaflavin-dependent oxidoreductase (nitroreductase family)